MFGAGRGLVWREREEREKETGTGKGKGMGGDETHGLNHRGNLECRSKGFGPQ